LNVPERLSLGSTTVYSSEVAEVITRVLEYSGSFPENAKPWAPGLPVYTTILERISDRQLRLTQQLSETIQPRVLRAQKVRYFENTCSAVDSFIRTEWPRGIDGIAIVWAHR
jgi:hypothetical protein